MSEFRDGRLVKYIYVGSEKVARSDFSGEAGQPIVPDLLYLHDHLGSTTVAMDAAGTVRQISSHSPYGHNRLKGLSGSQAIDYGFSGKELHDSPDLAYFETRFLSSGLARFTQTDTLTLNPPEDWRLSPQKWHPYSYCWGNPVGLLDRDGREGISSGHNSADRNWARAILSMGNRAEIKTAINISKDRALQNMQQERALKGEIARLERISNGEAFNKISERVEANTEKLRDSVFTPEMFATDFLENVTKGTPIGMAIKTYNTYGDIDNSATASNILTGIMSAQMLSDMANDPKLNNKINDLKAQLESVQKSISLDIIFGQEGSNYSARKIGPSREKTVVL